MALVGLALTACQPQDIDYDKIGEAVAEAAKGTARVQSSFYGSGARLIELEQGDFNVYAVATRSNSSSYQSTPEIQVKIKPLGGLWTELITVRAEGEEEVLVGIGNLKIENQGLYVLHGYANELIEGWWHVDLFRR